MAAQVEEKSKHSGGIKSRGFGGNPDNGKSHRANAARKKLQHLKNVRARASLYSEMQGERGGGARAKEWHTRLDSLSQGTA